MKTSYNILLNSGYSMKPKLPEQNFWYEFKEIKGAQWKRSDIKNFKGMWAHSTKHSNEYVYVKNSGLQYNK